MPEPRRSERLQKQIEEITERLRKAMGQRLEHECKKRETEYEISAVKQKIVTAGKSKETLLGRQGSLSNQHSQFYLQQSRLREKSNVLRSNRDRASGKLRAKKHELEKCNITVSFLKKKIASLNDSTVRVIVDEPVLTLGMGGGLDYRKVTTFQKPIQEINECEEKLTEACERQTKKEDEVATAQSNYNQALGEYNANHNNLEQNKKVIEDVERQISEVKDQIRDVGREIFRLKTEQTKLERVHGRLEVVIFELENQENNLEIEIVKLRGSLASEQMNEADAAVHVGWQSDAEKAQAHRAESENLRETHRRADEAYAKKIENIKATAPSSFPDVSSSLARMFGPKARPKLSSQEAPLQAGDTHAKSQPHSRWGQEIRGDVAGAIVANTPVLHAINQGSQIGSDAAKGRWTQLGIRALGAAQGRLFPTAGQDATRAAILHNMNMADKIDMVGEHIEAQRRDVKRGK